MECPDRADENLSTQATAIKMKFIALTGATGVVGTRLQEYFSDAEFLIFDGDIRDEKTVKKFCRAAASCDAFIHFHLCVPSLTANGHSIACTRGAFICQRGDFQVVNVREE